MSCFASEETLQTKAADPTKHVNYVQGMVLGVDHFDQEFTLSLGTRPVARARSQRIRYGQRTGSNDRGQRQGQTRREVSPGVAVSRRGQLIRVAPKQCAVPTNGSKVPSARTSQTEPPRCRLTSSFATVIARPTRSRSSVDPSAPRRNRWLPRASSMIFASSCASILPHSARKTRCAISSRGCGRSRLSISLPAHRI